MAVVKEKMSGELTTKEIMEKYGIKNKTQISTRMRWYRSKEFYRFDQPIVKQYTYGHGPDIRSEEDRKNLQISHLDMVITAIGFYHQCHLMYRRLTQNVPSNDKLFTTSYLLYNKHAHN